MPHKAEPPRVPGRGGFLFLSGLVSLSRRLLSTCNVDVQHDSQKEVSERWKERLAAIPDGRSYFSSFLCFSSCSSPCTRRSAPRCLSTKPGTLAINKNHLLGGTAHGHIWRLYTMGGRISDHLRSVLPARAGLVRRWLQRCVSDCHRLLEPRIFCDRPSSEHGCPVQSRHRSSDRRDAPGYTNWSVLNPPADGAPFAGVLLAENGARIF